MNIEQRLQSAANELNNLARHSAPPAFGSRTDRIRPWLAFAAAFAVVLAVLGIPSVLTNFGGRLTDGEAPLGGAGTSTTTTMELTSPVGDPTCEAVEAGPATTMAYSSRADGSDERDLTEPVADKVYWIGTAARECDFEAIAALAADNFTTSFGGGGVDYIAELHDQGEPIYTILAEVLNMSHDIIRMEDGSRLYVWPAAFAYDTWDEIPAPAMEELLRIYTQEELDQISLLGSYGGWRVGITEAGEWIFFVAGD
jgi:hypothetical protein